MTPGEFRKLLLARRVTIGSWIQINSATSAEGFTLLCLGADTVFLDRAARAALEMARP